MKLLVLRVGKPTERWADEAVENWSKRLRKHGGLEQDWVKHEVFRGDIEAVRRAESDRLLKRIGPRDMLIAVDERGQTPDSIAFSQLIEENRNRSTYRMVFALGGAYGHSADLRKRANLCLSLSSCVLNHEVARVVLVEQIYRAFTILDGTPYHH